jgi:hypothetical protein
MNFDDDLQRGAETAVKRFRGRLPILVSFLQLSAVLVPLPRHHRARSTKGSKHGRI